MHFINEILSVKLNSRCFIGDSVTSIIFQYSVFESELICTHYIFYNIGNVRFRTNETEYAESFAFLAVLLKVIAK